MKKIIVLSLTVLTLSQPLRAVELKKIQSWHGNLNSRFSGAQKQDLGKVIKVENTDCKEIITYREYLGEKIISPGDAPYHGYEIRTFETITNPKAHAFRLAAPITIGTTIGGGLAGLAAKWFLGRSYSGIWTGMTVGLLAGLSIGYIAYKLPPGPYEKGMPVTTWTLTKQD